MTMTNEARGKLHAMFNLIEGAVGAGELDIDRVTDTLGTLYRSRLQFVPQFVPREWEVWKRVSCDSTAINGTTCKQALRDAGVDVESMANRHIDRALQGSRVDRVANLVRAKVSELGFGAAVSLEEIYDRARRLGLRPVSKDLAIYLCCEYGDRKDHEWMIVASEPLEDTGGHKVLFLLSIVQDRIQLGVRFVQPKNSFMPNEILVFERC